jgi:uncharacterized membrane protein
MYRLFNLLPIRGIHFFEFHTLGYYPCLWKDFVEMHPNLGIFLTVRNKDLRLNHDTLYWSNYTLVLSSFCLAYCFKLICSTHTAILRFRK